MDNTIYLKLKEQKKYLKEKYQITNIGIFGSYARGEETDSSDIDILVEFNKVPDLFKYIDAEIYLEKILQKKVDLVEKKSIRKELKERILQEVQYI